MNTTRRTFLGGIAAASVPASAVAAVQGGPSQPNIDAFLASATAAERAEFHANALVKAMAEIRPDRSWRSKIVPEYCFAIVVGDEMEAPK